MTHSASFNSAVVLTVLESCFDDVDPQLAASVTEFVERQTAALPPHIRMAVVGLRSTLIASSTLQLRGGIGHLDRQTRHRIVSQWDKSRFSPVRQYIRLVRSLVLFAAYESALGDAAGAESRGDQLASTSP